MEKTLSYEEQVKIKNLLTKVKSHMTSIEFSKDEVYKIIDVINEILIREDE